MNIYRKKSIKTDYRKIYEQNYGKIPMDSEGRSYHIHHIDGNRENNNPNNLKAVSLEEHYEIHKQQGDWAACIRLAAILHISKDEKSELSKRHNESMFGTGNHPWQNSQYATERNISLVQKGIHNFLGGKIQSEMNFERVKNGTHPFMKREDGSSLASDRTKNGTNPFQKRTDGSSLSSDAIANRTHPTQKLRSCVHCGVSGKGSSNYSRYHKDGICLAKSK